MTARIWLIPEERAVIRPRLQLLFPQFLRQPPNLVLRFANMVTYVRTSPGGAAECSHGHRPWLFIARRMSRGAAKESFAAPRLSETDDENHGRWPWLIWSDLSIREHSGFFLSPGIPKL